MNKQIKEILDARRLKAERVANHYKQLILSMPKVKKLYQEEVDLILQKAKAEAFGEVLTPHPLTRPKRALMPCLPRLAFSAQTFIQNISAPFAKTQGLWRAKSARALQKSKAN